MFSEWFGLPAWAILLSLVLVYGGVAAAIVLVCFRLDGRPRLAAFAGVAPPFLGLPTLLFGLMAGFLASDVWDHARQISRAVLDERDAAILIESIDQVTPAVQLDLDYRVHEYVRAVLAEEIPANDERGSPHVNSLLEGLMREIASKELGSQVGSSVQSGLLTAVARLSSARSTRLALSGIGADKLKWTAVACLAVLAQLGVMVVHLERRRPQIAALLTFTGCVVAVMTLIAVCEQPFRASSASAAPLASALPPGAP